MCVLGGRGSGGCLASAVGPLGVWLQVDDGHRWQSGVMDDAKKEGGGVERFIRLSRQALKERCEAWRKKKVKRDRERRREKKQRKKKQKGKSMTGNLGICRTEIGSHLDRLSKRKADFTADGLPWQVCRPQGARVIAAADLLTQTHRTVSARLASSAQLFINSCII